MYDLPIYVWALVLFGVIGIPATTCAVLYRGALAVGLGRRTATEVAAVAGVVMTGWLVVSGLLAYSGAYREDSGNAVPWLGVLVAVTLPALLLATRIPVMARILTDRGTVARLTLPHSLRVAGVLFLIVMAQGHLPAAFALPAGLGDIATGIAAPFVYRRLIRGDGHSRAVWFNLFGIVDLLVAASLGFLLFSIVDITPSTAPLRLLPLALVPTIPVPLAVALHIVSLRRLHTNVRPFEDLAERRVPAAG